MQLGSLSLIKGHILMAYAVEYHVQLVQMPTCLPALQRSFTGMYYLCPLVTS